MNKEICEKYREELENINDLKSRFDSALIGLKKGEHQSLLDLGKKISEKTYVFSERGFWDWREGEKEVYNSEDEIWKESGYWDKRSPTFSHNGESVAFIGERIEKDYKKSVLVVDGKEWENEKEIDRIDGVSFSPDGRKVVAVFHNKKDDKYEIVENGKTRNRFDRIFDKPIYSDDSEHILFTVPDPDGEGKFSYFVDDKPSEKTFEYFRWGKFTSDGRVLHSMNTENPTRSQGVKKRTVGVDGEIAWEGEWDKCYNPTMSLDGTKIAAIVGDAKSPRGDTEYGLAINGKEWPGRKFERYHAGLSPVFSPDSKRVAIVINKGTGSSILIGDENDVITEWEDKGDNTYYRDGVFSPDSDLFMAIRVANLENESGARIVIEDRLSKEKFARIENLTFSPDGEKVMFIAQKDDKKWYRIVKNVQDIYRESEAL